MSQLTNYDLRLEQYLSDTIRWVSSLEVKIDSIGINMNHRLFTFFGDSYEELPKDQWMYYINLSGEYHVRNEVMKVTSLDNGDEIIFNKENMSLHPKTKITYQQDEELLNLLMAQYPYQENLIKRILDPVDMDTALDAIDGTILYHAPGFIEEREIYLLPTLETRIMDYVNRWLIKGFVVSDDLYLAAFISILYSQIIGWVLELRIKYKRSHYGCNFHWDMEIANYLNIDEHVSNLPEDRRYYLMKNLPFLVRKVGSQELSETLYQNLYQDPRLRLYYWSDVQKVDNTQLTFDHVYQTTTITGSEKDSEISTLTTLDNLLGRDQNTINYLETLRDRKDLLKDSKTKLNILQSEIIKNSTQINTNTVELHLSQWLYLVGSGQYRNNTALKITNGYKETLLNQKEVILLLLYILNKQRGDVLEEVNSLIVPDIFKFNITLEELNLNINDPEILSFNEELSSLLSNLKTPISLKVSLLEHISKVNQAINLYSARIMDSADIQKRLVLVNLLKRHNIYYKFYFDGYANYSDFFTKNNIDQEYLDNNLDSVLNEIFSELFDINLEDIDNSSYHESIVNIHKSLLGLGTEYITNSSKEFSVPASMPLVFIRSTSVSDLYKYSGIDNLGVDRPPINNRELFTGFYQLTPEQQNLIQE